MLENFTAEEAVRYRGFGARVVLDSVSPAGARLTTMEWVYPRFIHAEVMTYRMFSRNTSSSRAIPIKRMVQKVITNPAGPVYWGRNQRGMQAREELTGWQKWTAQQMWYKSRYAMVATALGMYHISDLHKQIANRVLEPWYWITAIITASPVAWENCFRQRCHPDAQPEFQVTARLARWAYTASVPSERTFHAPFVYAHETDIPSPEALGRISVARCARVSYETHLGTRDIGADLDLYRKLHLEQDDGEIPHTSPAEHVARSHEDPTHRSGNVFGWTQWREEVDPYFIHFVKEEAA